MVTKQVDTTRVVGRQQRAIGPIGTAARIGLAAWVGLAVFQQWSTGQLQLYTPVLGLVVFPAMIVLVAMTWQRVRHTPIPGNGPQGIIINHAIIFVLLAIPATSLAASLFYGASALLAAVRDYKGCEVVAISNTLLRRHDEVGCFLFTPADALDSRLTHKPRKKINPGI
ncbi:MAG: hypothetical protein O7D33_04885 [Chloroflexi bacterium]|nr:hypothetical protein [Chloroflexota bacterium]